MFAIVCKLHWEKKKARHIGWNSHKIFLCREICHYLSLGISQTNERLFSVINCHILKIGTFYSIRVQNIYVVQCGEGELPLKINRPWHGNPLSNSAETSFPNTTNLRQQLLFSTLIPIFNDKNVRREKKKDYRPRPCTSALREDCRAGRRPQEDCGVRGGPL